MNVQLYCAADQLCAGCKPKPIELLPKKGFPQQPRSILSTQRKVDKFQLPHAALEYFIRVGATINNFGRAVVLEKNGKQYHSEKTVIKIGKDGTIDCRGNADHSPTPEEAVAIKEAFVGLKFPVPIQASEAGYKKFINDQQFEPGDCFPMHDRRTNKIVMFQRRSYKEDGNKFYTSYSLWSDNVWRAMQPDDKLPFWKPKKRRGRARIMVHEGPAKARYVDWMLNDLSPEAQKAKEMHPWAQQLDVYEHWGMVGGAYCAHRADCTELRSENPIEVIYVADNDEPGRTALQEFSRNYKGRMKGVIFHQSFPESWDMKDKIPKGLFKGDGGERRYIGPTLKSMMFPATFATELKKASDRKGRPAAVLRDPFKAEWMHTVSPEVFIHRD